VQIGSLLPEMGPIGCPETWVTNYKTKLRKIQEERRSKNKTRRKVKRTKNYNNKKLKKAEYF